MAAIKWRSAASGNWNLAANWTPGNVPKAADDATINLAGTYTVTISDAEAAKSLTVADAAATIDLTGTLTLSGLLTLTAGNFVLASGAEISGGTISSTGTLVANGGTLSAVTYRGTLDLSAEDANLTVSDGLSLTGAAGTGAGTILLTGEYSELTIASSTTLDNATIDFGTSMGQSYLRLANSGVTLTLGSKLDIEQTDLNAQIALNSNNSVINRGTIDADIGGGDFALYYGVFTNQGTIDVTSGDTLDASTAVFSNTGTIIVDDATLSLGSWSNSGGSITVDSGTLDLGGSFTIARLKAIAMTDATVNVVGALDNTGGTLALGEGNAIAAGSLSGSITKGIIADADGDLVGDGGALIGVTYQGTLDLSSTYASLGVSGGLTLQGQGGVGAATVLLTGSDSTLSIASGTTLDNATIQIGNISEAATLNLSTYGGTITLGPKLILDQADLFARIDSNSAATVVNQGMIAAGIAGGDFTVTYGTLANAATISVSNGDTFDASTAILSNTGKITVTDATLSLGTWSDSGGGAITVTDGTLKLGGSLTTAQLKTIAMTDTTVTIAGTLDNTGGTLTIGAGDPIDAVNLSGTITNGIIVDAGSNLVTSNGTFSGVTYEGTLDLSAAYAQYLTVEGGSLTLTGTGGTGPGTALFTGDGSYLYVASTMLLNNATIDIGNDTYEDYLDLSGPGETLTLGPKLTLQQAGIYAEITSAYTNDVVINQGTIAADFSGGDFVVNYGTFTNQGTINVTDGDTVDLSYVGDFSNLSGSVLTGGTLSVGYGSTLQLANNSQIATDKADIILDGANALIESENTTTYKQVSLDATLATIASGGTLALLDGRDFTAIANAGTFTDSGTLLLGASTFGATAFTVNGGTIAGSGTIATPITILGTAVATGGTIVLAGAISGSGVLSVAASGAVALNAGGKLTGSVTDAGTIMLAGGTVTAASLTIAAGGTLSGFGTWTGTITDGGSVDATGGTLVVAGLTGLTGGTWSGKGIEADAASVLQLANNTTVATDAGGIVLSGVGSVIQSLNTTTTHQVSLDTTLDAIAAAGTLSLLGGRSFTAVANGGAFADAGTLVLGGADAFAATKLSLANGARISGSGTVTAASTVTGGVILSGGTLALKGSLLGAGTLSIAAGELLLLDAAGTAFTGTLSDAGTVQLAGTGLAASSVSVLAGGTITGYGTITGPITDAGLLDAAGGTLSVTGLAGLSTGTLSKGAIEADAASVLQLGTNTAIGTVAGTVTLSGAGSVIESLNTTTNKQVSLDSTLAHIAAGGTLAVLTGRAFTANAGAFTDAGLLDIAGGGFSATTVTVAAGGTLLDAGNFSGAIVNSGTVNIAAGTVLTLSGGGAIGGVFTGAGTLRLTGTKAFTIAATTQITTGLLQIAAGATLSGAGTIAAPLDDAGTVLAQGGTLTLDGSLSSGGTLSAAAGAVLQIADGGTFLGTVDGAGAVVNMDAIYGAAAGIALAGTGTLSLTNDSGGDIEGGTGDGALLQGGTVVVNNAGGIGGTSHGLHLSGQSISVINYDLIAGDTGAGILASATGSVTIVNNGVIGDYEGVGVAAISLNGAASATVTNSGMIIGGYYLAQGAPAIQFGAGNDRLIVLPGAVFMGDVYGGGGANTLELAAGPTVGAVGTISGLGTNFQSFGTVVEDANAHWTLDAGNTLPAGSSISVAQGGTLTLTGVLTAAAGATIGGAGLIVIGQTGTVQITAASGTSVTRPAGTLTDQGTLDVSGGGTLNLAGSALTNLSAGILSGGVFEVDGASVLQFAANAAITTDDASIVFDGVGGTMQWQNTATNTVKTLAQSLTTIGATGDLTLSDGAHFTSAGTLAVQGTVQLATGTLTATALTVAAAGTVIGSGTIAGGIADAGLVEASGGTLTLTGDLTGSGTIAIDTNAVLTADGKLGTVGMTFLGGGDQFALAQPAQFTGAITGFSTSDSIDLLGAVVTGLSYAANVLTVSGAAGTIAKLHFAGDYSDYGFGHFTDGHGGSLIQLT